ncbi:MAG: (2Fe-2S) ferredoxin domain-containing protein [Cyanobacteria bacterium P01_D01_bin.105]
MDRTIRVCQNITCHKQGSAKVLAAFEKHAPDGVVVEGSSCLGHCGSGPNVLILPENEWCLHVQPKDVNSLVRQYLDDIQTSSAPQSEADKVFQLWLWVIGGAVAVIVFLSWLIAKHSYYI